MTSLWRGLFMLQSNSNNSKDASSSSPKSRSRARSFVTSGRFTTFTRHRGEQRYQPPPTPSSLSTTPFPPPRVPSHKRSSSFSAPANVKRPALYNPSHGPYEHPRPPIHRAHGHSHSESLIKQVHHSRADGSIHTPTISFSSSRTRSNSSVHIGGVSILGSRSRTPSSSSLHRSDITPRPILKQNHTWNGDASINRFRRTTRYKPHTLLDGAHKNVLLYDILYAPGPRSVLNSTTRHPIPTSTLIHPATEPPILTEMVLKSHKFPWTISVFPRPPTAPPTSDTTAEKTSKFYIAGSKSATPAVPGAITVMDVLHAVHSSLSTRVTQAEWAALGTGSNDQKRVTRAYERRCEKMGGGWEGGVRRVDWLGRKTRLVGIEPDNEGDERTWKLIFSKV